MSEYQHLLVAVDLSDDSEQLVTKATRISQALGAKISLIHVLEFMWMYGPYATVSFADVESEIRQQSENNLLKLAQTCKIEPENCETVVGIPKIEIRKFADSHNVDLIVTGCHDKHGLGRLLGSTATAVINNTKCDVLSIAL